MEIERLRHSKFVTSRTNVLHDGGLHKATRIYAKAEPFLHDASQQPSVAQDVDNTFICDANDEVWELN